MEDYNNIYKNLISEISSILDKYGFSPVNFLKTTSENHKSANYEILASIAKHIFNENEKNEISDINSHKLELIIKQRIWNEEKNAANDNDKDYMLAHVLHTYLNAFFGKYFNIANNQYFTKDEKLKFVLPCSHAKDFDEFETNAKYIENCMGNIGINPIRELSLLILPDGTCYNAQNDHATCAKWLNVNGIDIDHAIRFETSKQFYDFNFGSLYNYGFSENSDKNELIQITDVQAQIIGDLYKSLYSKWKYLKNLENCIVNCRGFGFSYKDFNPDFCKRNLSKIEYETKGFFDGYEYMKYLREKIKNDPSKAPQK